MGIEPDLSDSPQKAGDVGTQTVQAIQDKLKQSLWMVETCKGTIPDIVLSLAVRIFIMNRIDLYNKSRMMREYHVRFRERLGVKFPLPTRPRER
jgi:hypothetical protein